MRERLAGIIPGVSDTAGWVDLLGELEALKNTATAAQAQLAVALEVPLSELISRCEVPLALKVRSAEPQSD